MPPPRSVDPAFVHQPVMVAEVLEALAPVPAGLLVDATAGGGGHARALLEARSDCRLLGLDRDATAVAAAGAVLAPFGERARVVQAPFGELGGVLTSEAAEAEVTGILFDLGVSSPQLDEPGRGFSYRADAPLDMRMDRTQALSAAEVVNEYEEAELARIIARYGEERFARAIARRIVARRPLRTTGELAEIVRDAIPAPARRRGGHPARRTFQALRIEVNRELEQLDRGLDDALDALAPGGRVAVLSYHSLEDRMVKRRFAERAGTAPAPGVPLPPLPPEPSGWRLCWRGARRPSTGEVAANPRAESARFRAVERLFGPPAAPAEKGARR